MLVNDYTVHIKILEILENDKKGDTTLLFIDELNRCDPIVQQELMQLINDRKINYIDLPDSCKIMAAGNPEEDDYMDYQVNTMNSALIDRFIIVDMKSDHKEWLEWAVKNKNIDPDVVAFITDNYEYLHTVEGDDRIKSTPRGWKIFSDVITEMKRSKRFNLNLVYNVGSGIVGDSATQSFVTFLENEKNPLIDVEKLVYDKNIDDLLKQLSNESIIRMNVTLNRCVEEIYDVYKKEGAKALTSKGLTERLIEILKVVSEDVLYSVVNNLRNSYSDMNNILTNNMDYSDLYFDVLSNILK